MIVHYSTDNGCYLTSDHFVYFYNYNTHKLSLECRLPPLSNDFRSRAKDFIARSWLYRRLKRSPGIWHLVKDDSGRIIVIYDRVYLFEPGQSTIFMKPLVQTIGEKNFESPMRNGCALHEKSQHIYFGEYVNDGREIIRIFKVDTNQQAISCCYEFSRQEIKHIHAIKYDPFRNRLWITTGDSDHESAFYYTDDEFKTVHFFSGGDQTWRAVGLLFDEHGIEWGMDAGKDASADQINIIYRYDFNTQKRTEIVNIGNPAYYAIQSVDGGAWLATTYEPGRPQNTPTQATLWYRNTSGEWTKSQVFDYVPHEQSGVSKYAQLLLPGGKLPAGVVCFTPINSKQHYQAKFFDFNR